MAILEFLRKIWSEQIAQNNMEIYLINEEDNPAVKKYFVNGWLTVFENISKTGGELNPSSKRGSPCLLLRGEARGHLGAKVLLGLNKINTMREHLHIKYSCSVRCKPPHVSTLAWHESHSETQSSGFSLILVNWLNQGKHLSWPVHLNIWFTVWNNLNKVVLLQKSLMLLGSVWGLWVPLSWLKPFQLTIQEVNHCFFSFSGMLVVYKKLYYIDSEAS